MKILLLGGNGMIGHEFFQVLKKNHEVKVTLRQNLDHYSRFGLFNEENSFSNVDVRSIERLEEVIAQFLPDAVINAVGITKQLVGPENLKTTIEVNALFPHRLTELCKRFNARMIQLSTDCVFSGKKGFYSEDDISDAQDVYGRTKFLGEISSPHVVTIRKSTIGLELEKGHGLVEWFLSQTGSIRGFRNAIYSGLISSELAFVIERILLNYTDLSGVWNVASEPISKYDLLLKLQQRIGREDIKITPDDDFICDRSLDGSCFEEQTGYKSPKWDQMLDILASQIKERI